MFRIGRLNKITLTKGDDAVFKVRLYNGNEQIKPLTGQLTMTARKTPEGTLLFSVNADSDGFIQINHSLTEQAETGLYIYDLQYTDENDFISTVVKSELELTEEVTINE